MIRSNCSRAEVQVGRLDHAPADLLQAPVGEAFLEAFLGEVVNSPALLTSVTLPVGPTARTRISLQ